MRGAMRERRFIPCRHRGWWDGEDLGCGERCRRECGAWAWRGSSCWENPEGKKPPPAPTKSPSEAPSVWTRTLLSPLLLLLPYPIPMVKFQISTFLHSLTPLSYPFTWIHTFLIFSLILFILLPSHSFLHLHFFSFFFFFLFFSFLFFLTFFLFLSLSIFPFPADFNNQIYKQKTIPPSLCCWRTSYYIRFFIYWNRKWKKFDEFCLIKSRLEGKTNKGSEKEK